jgi:GAF domain-containing protein
MELDELIGVVNEVAASLQLPMDLEATLDRITRSAAESIPGIDHASISVTTKGGRIQTLAPTDAVATRADELQYELRQGPCYEAVAGEPVVQVDDLATDLRWPSTVRRPRLSSGSVRSCLSSSMPNQMSAEL